MTQCIGQRLLKMGHCGSWPYSFFYENPEEQEFWMTQQNLSVIQVMGRDSSSRDRPQAIENYLILP